MSLPDCSGQTVVVLKSDEEQTLELPLQYPVLETNGKGYDTFKRGDVDKGLNKNVFI